MKEFSKDKREREDVMALQQKVILLIEDDQGLNQGIYLALGQIEYQILQAYSLEEARMLYQKNGLDLILLDINLPDGSG